MRKPMCFIALFLQAVNHFKNVFAFLRSTLHHDPLSFFLIEVKSAQHEGKKDDQGAAQHQQQEFI